MISPAAPELPFNVRGEVAPERVNPLEIVALFSVASPLVESVVKFWFTVQLFVCPVLIANAVVVPLPVSEASVPSVTQLGVLPAPFVIATCPKLPAALLNNNAEVVPSKLILFRAFN